MTPLLIEMNLSPTWVDTLKAHGVDSVHWSSVGDARAADPVVMAWARTHGFAVFTHDLDFGTALALTRDAGPSVIRFRAQDDSPPAFVARLVETLRRHERAIENGALVTIDVASSATELPRSVAITSTQHQGLALGRTRERIGNRRPLTVVELPIRQ